MKKISIPKISLIFALSALILSPGAYAQRLVDRDLFDFKKDSVRVGFHVVGDGRSFDKLSNAQFRVGGEHGFTTPPIVGLRRYANKASSRLFRGTGELSFDVNSVQDVVNLNFAPSNGGPVQTDQINLKNVFAENCLSVRDSDNQRFQVCLQEEDYYRNWDSLRTSRPQVYEPELYYYLVLKSDRNSQYCADIPLQRKGLRQTRAIVNPKFSYEYTQSTVSGKNSPPQLKLVTRNNKSYVAVKGFGGLYFNENGAAVANPKVTTELIDIDRLHRVSVRDLCAPSDSGGEFGRVLENDFFR